MKIQCLIRDMVQREVAKVVRCKVREVVAREIEKHQGLNDAIQIAALDETEWYTRQVA